MSMIFTFNKFKKASFLFFFLLFCSYINATNYYLKVSGGSTRNWNDSTTWSTVSGGASGGANTGTYPKAGDNVYYNGSTATVTLNITADAACANFYNEGINASTVINMNFSNNVTLTISGLFQITGSTSYSRTTNVLYASGSTTGAAISVGTNVVVSQTGQTFTTARNFIMNFAGPNITVAGNIYLNNCVNGSIYGRAYITHSAGKVSLTGTGSNGYINTAQNATGLSTNNRYLATAGSATIEFSHVSDCPIITEQGITNAPDFSTTGTTVIYKGSGSGSVIYYGSSYYNLYLNNSAGYTTNGATKVTNEMDIVAGSLNIGSTSFTMQGSSGAATNMNISSGGGVTGSGTFSLSSPCNITYSGSVTAAGIELVSGTLLTNTKIKTLTLSNTSNFNLGTDASLFITDSVLFNDNNFTCNEASITCPSITLSGSPSGYNTYNNTFVTGTLSVYGKSSITYDQSITETLILGANLVNSGIITVPNVSVTANSTLNGAGIGMIKVGTLLSVNTGAVLAANGDITLVSDATNTARVGQVSSGAITGNVVVQRYLANERRLWRLITAPVKGSTGNSIYANWQNGGAQYNGDDPNGTGTDVWGTSPDNDPTVNGLYYIPIATHNFRKYNNGWTSITNSMSEPLFTSSGNNAFLAFITYPAGMAVNVGGGGNGENIGVASSAETTLIATGNLMTGTQTYSLPLTNYYLIGNPYASPIDFSNIISASGDNGNTITEKIWIMDPKLGFFGNYVTWDPAGLYSDDTAQNAIQGNTLIQSGQAFFVKGKSGASSSTFIIKESNKGTTTDASVFGKTSSVSYERIRINVDKVENGIDTHKDACVVTFYQGASNAVDEKDVQKFTNPVETLAFLNGSTSLSSEHRAPIVDADVLFIKLSQAVANTYKLKLHTENFTFAGTAYLYDLFLGTNVALPLDGSVFVYPFDVTSDAASQGARFKIVFSTALSTVKNDNPYSIVAYPNPTTKANGVNVNLGSLEYGNYNYKIVNVLGQVVQNGSFEKQQLNQEVAISFNNSVREGWYAIQILDKNSTLYTLPILIK